MMGVEGVEWLGQTRAERQPMAAGARVQGVVVQGFLRLAIPHRSPAFRRKLFRGFSPA